MGWEFIKLYIRSLSGTKFHISQIIPMQNKETLSNVWYELKHVLEHFCISGQLISNYVKKKKNSKKILNVLEKKIKNFFNIVQKHIKGEQ